MTMLLLVIGLIYWLTKCRFLKFVMAVVLILWLAQISFIIGSFIGLAPSLMNMLSELIKML